MEKTHAQSQEHIGHEHSEQVSGTEADAVIDPVCGMNVPLNAGKPHETWHGEEFHFCSDDCHGKFQADPYFYASGNSKRVKEAANQNALYTCPMHPEVIQEGPGACPICGMSLEPMVASDDQRSGSHPSYNSYNGWFGRVSHS